MRKTINYKLGYVEGGKEKEKTVKIFFVSHAVNLRYSKLVDKITNFKKKYDEMTRTLQDRGTILYERKDGWKGKLKSLTDKQDKLEKEVREYDDEAVTAERVALIKLMLDQNGIKDSQLYDDTFWENCVEPSMQMDFLVRAVLKDNNTAGGQTAKSGE